jgi:hypothetical protein
MTKRPEHRRETFLRRALRSFGEGLQSGLDRGNHWRRSAGERMDLLLDSVRRWMWNDKKRSFLLLSVVVWIGLQIWFVVDWSTGGVQGNGVQTGVGGLIGGAVVGLIASPFVAMAILLLALVLNWTIKLVVPIVLSLIFLVWAVAYALIQVIAVALKLLLLVPLAFLFVTTRLIELWRGIFYTCPSRQCAYRGLPAYVCPRCGTGNHDLWPNLYGLFWHACISCGASMPTLDLFGRGKLKRLCGGPDCSIPLEGRHAGRAKERLVAIAGGPAAGKTTYLLMVVHEILLGQTDGHPTGGISKGEIDDPRHLRSYLGAWRELSKGQTVAKTAEVAQAFLMYTRIDRSACQLYLYDSPGEEFVMLSGMDKRHYLPLLEGVIFLVDPFSFNAIAIEQGRKKPAESLKMVVDTTVATALMGARLDRDGRLPMRAAVVISKADLRSVRDQIGDILAQEIPGPVCRKALETWGAGGSMRLLEHRFAEVEYFACSGLGREYDPKDRRSFESAGVLPPLNWILTGKRK